MPKRILVVDNELRSREMIAHFLREASYEVEQADDGGVPSKCSTRRNLTL